MAFSLQFFLNNSEIDRLHLFEFSFLNGWSSLQLLRCWGDLNGTLRGIIRPWGRFHRYAWICSHHRIDEVVQPWIDVIRVVLPSLTTSICWVHIKTCPPFHSAFFLRKDGAAGNFRHSSRVNCPKVAFHVWSANLTIARLIPQLAHIVNSAFQVAAKASLVVVVFKLTIIRH